MNIYESANLKVDEEEGVEDDAVHIVVCGTSDEGNLIDFAREHGGGGQGDIKVSVSGEGEEGNADHSAKRTAALNSHLQNKKLKKEGITNSPSIPLFSPAKSTNLHNTFAAATEFMNREEVIDYMTQNKKVLLEWELNAYPLSSSSSSSSSSFSSLSSPLLPSWLNVPLKNKSNWFNYGLDEYTFKEWIQRQLDERLSRLERQKISNFEENDYSSFTNNYICNSDYSSSNLSNNNTCNNYYNNGELSSNSDKPKNYSNRYNSYSQKSKAYNKNEYILQSNISSQKLYSHVASDNYGVNIQRSSASINRNLKEEKNIKEEIRNNNIKCIDDKGNIDKEKKSGKKEEKKNEEGILNPPKLNEAILMKLKGLGSFLKSV